MDWVATMGITRASCAVRLRTLRRSPPEQARLRENGETTFGAEIRG